MLQFRVIAFDDDVIGGCLEEELDIAWHAAPQQHGQGVKQRGQLHPFDLHLGAARKRKHRGNHLESAFGAIADEGSVLAQLLVVVLLHRGRSQQQGLKDVAQVMAEAAGEHGQTLEALRADQFLFRALAGNRLACLVNRAAHRRSEPGQTPLEQVVGGATLERLDRLVFADCSGHENER